MFCVYKMAHMCYIYVLRNNRNPFAISQEILLFTVLEFTNKAPSKSHKLVTDYNPKQRAKSIQSSFTILGI